MDRTPLAGGFPRPGKALKAVLITIAAAGLLNALLYNWIPGGKVVFHYLTFDPSAIQDGRWWRLYAFLTSGLLTLPNDSAGVWHLAFTLIGLYFLSNDLERRWGAWRFVRFLFISVAVGTGLVLAFDKLTPPGATLFHPQQLLFGATAAITGTSVAWGRENPSAVIRLFFFLPMTGRWLLWVTIGFCGLYLLYGAQVPEGAIAPFGGVLTGLLLGGSPSALRRLYLQAKLWVLRRSGAPVVDIDVPGVARPRRPRSGPPLRVVMGGLEDEKKDPPKDKRYLN
jgi:membrane associated rhomboid family serine protease